MLFFSLWSSRRLVCSTLPSGSACPHATPAEESQSHVKLAPTLSLKSKHASILAQATQQLEENLCFSHTINNLNYTMISIIIIIITIIIITSAKT